MTKLWQPSQLDEPARLLQQNEVVAFPTETVYGLGGNAFSDEAVRKIFAAKGRPSDNPLIVHIASLEQLRPLVSSVPPLADKLMQTFWPGPLTLVLPGSQKVSSHVTAGLDTVAVRMPDHPIALELIRKTGLPLAAPSANLSGKPSPTRADHVLEDLAGKIPGVVDGGPTGIGVESTVVDVTGEVPLILRPGGISKKELESVVGRVDWDEAVSPSQRLSGQDSNILIPRSPGMKYRHYAPKGEMWLVQAETVPGMIRLIRDRIRYFHQHGKKVGVLTTREHQREYPEADAVVVSGNRSQPESVARSLYGALRKLDEHQVDVILAETFPSEGMGEALMNRLYKASGGQILSDFA